MRFGQYRVAPNATKFSSDSFVRGSAMTSQFELKVLTLLRSVDLMRDIETDKLKKLAAIAREVVFEPDQVIYRRGDTGQAVYLIEEGEVVIEMDVPTYAPSPMPAPKPAQLCGS